MPRVLVCGDRNWTNKESIHKVLSRFSNITVIHGGCRGADELAGEVAKELGFAVIVFPAEWHKYGRAAGPIRNAKMLSEGKPDAVFAFHADIKNSKGTKNMVCKAKLNKIPTQVVDS